MRRSSSRSGRSAARPHEGRYYGQHDHQSLPQVGRDAKPHPELGMDIEVTSLETDG